jgi:uncharacterized protein YqhQ
MGWKNLSYWLKGAIIGLIFSPLVALIIDYIYRKHNWVCERNALGFDVVGKHCSMGFMNYFYIIIVGILLFMFIGWFINKMKNWSHALRGGIIAIFFPSFLGLASLLSALSSDPGYSGVLFIIMIPVIIVLFPIGYFIGRAFDKKQEEVSQKQNIEEKSRWRGICGLVFGILSLILCVVYFAGLPLALIGFIFSSLQNKIYMTKSSVAGKIASIIGFVLSLCFIILYIILSIDHGGWMKF